MVGAKQTLDFVCASIRPCTLLDVGCGEGEVAALLAAAGFKVLAVDSDPEAVATARARGINVVCADFLAFDCPPAGAVLFSRSLHHIADPAAAVRHARALLRPGGQLLIEDFDSDGVDLPAATWLYDVMALAAEICGQAFDPIEDPLAAWRADHPRDHIHPGQVLDEAIRSVYVDAERLSAPYLYRYVADLVPNEAAERLVGAVLHWESRLIARGSLPAIGQLWRCRPSGRAERAVGRNQAP
jgi:SAM-dependent methyltransferase